MLPRVVIVGRPNVGKSTLFNRLAGVRRAIVDRVPGSTRDRNVAVASWAGRDFELVDTGGLFEKPESSIEQQMADQAQMAMEDAALICWVVDGITGVLPEDLALAQRLRAQSERVLLVVNKIDHPGRHGDAMEFHRLGFPRLYEITAEHGQGVAELLDEMVRELPESEQEVERAETRVAIVGRPNVGKSSLLNRLVGRSRCVVHEMAGTTRDAVDTIVEKGRQTYRFVDTAGIRRKGKTPSRADRLGVLYAERAIERAHLCLLVLDGTEGIMREDAAIAAKVARAGRGAVLVFNKWDLVKDRERRARILGCETPERLPHLDFAPLVFVSALSGRSVSKLLPLVDLIREQQLRRIPTPELNRFLAAATSHYAPRGRHGKEVKFFFMTQIGVAPPRFVVFANEDKELQRDYSRYLVRRLREGFGFEGTPVRIVMRKRKQRP